MKKYPGIESIVLKNGTTAIYVTFKYQSKRYPTKNFTKLFGCRTEKQAYEKLQEVKVLISKGQNPFITTYTTLNDIWDARVATKSTNGEWRYTTVKNYGIFYERYIRKTIGVMKLEKIKYGDLKRIQDVDMAHTAKSTRNTLKLMIRPVFVEEIKKGNIVDNPFDFLDSYEMPVRQELSKRTNEKNLDIARKLYSAIEKYPVLAHYQKDEIKVFLYLTIMTARRYGEAMKLRKEHCHLSERKIIAPASITKTKEDYHYPIPDECMDYIDKIEEGLLFPTLKRGSVYQIFQRLLTIADVQVYSGKHISLHDTRRLMLTIMIKELKIDSVLADTCLNHKQKDTIKHYINFEYVDIEEAYKKYWDLIRAKFQESNPDAEASGS
jgi:integrase